LQHCIEQRKKNFKVAEHLLQASEEMVQREETEEQLGEAYLQLTRSLTIKESKH
jgi:hypothetical protein